MSQGFGYFGETTGADQPVNSAGFPRREGDRPHKDVGKVALAVAFQHRVYVVVDGVAHKGVEFAMKKLADFKGVVTPGQPVVVFHLFVLEEEGVGGWPGYDLGGGVPF